MPVKSTACQNPSMSMDPQQPYAPPPQHVYVTHQQAHGNGFAVASLILAIVGIVTGIIPLFIGLFLSFLPCILGILFGILGIIRAGKIQGRGQGMALAGLIIAGVNFLLYFTGYGIIW